jgi:hypothetical protein
MPQTVVDAASIPVLQDQIQIAEFMPKIALLDCLRVGRIDGLWRHERCQQVEMAGFRFMEPGEKTVHDL